MRADGQKLHHRRLVERQPFGRVKIGLRERDPLRHAAVAVDTETLERRAAIGLAAAAGNTGATGEIGDHDHRVAGLVGARLRRLDHLGGKLVPHDTGIFQEGVQTFEDVVVGAADADPADSEQDFVGASVG